MIEMNDRLMLYIDVLGFSDFIKGIPDDDLKKRLEFYESFFEKHNRREVFQEVTERDPVLAKIFPNVKTYIDDPESSVFSDSILTSYPEDMSEEFINDVSDRFVEGMRKRSLGTFIRKACEIQKEIILSLGLLVRGIIHIGFLHHEGHLIIGKGFIEVLELEKKKGKPVIYLSDEVYKRWKCEIDTELEKDKKRTFYRRNREDIYIFPAMLLAKDNKCEVERIMEKGLGEALELDKESEKDKASEKWKWMQDELRDYYSEGAQ